ncbi:unnamed protein product [Ceutorhynchus assimilis]|uniref:Uncharacterized protein n=1 Tax=Ceutorhynchus assimilis TaxID=467358 RepID=A0A9N9MMJ9_9CUCU|nr:unnamed protein product [Ceutorhynchus assimilis]
MQRGARDREEKMKNKETHVEKDQLNDNVSNVIRVEEAERLSREIVDKSETIESIKKQMHILEINCNGHEIKLRNYEEDIEIKRKEVEDQNTINRELVNTIRIFETDNAIYEKELYDMRQQINEMKEELRKSVGVKNRNNSGSSSRKDEIVIVENENDSGPSNKKNKIVVENKNRSLLSIKKIKNKLVVFTHDFGKHLWEYLNRVLGNRFVIQIVSKPFARLTDVVAGAECYIKDLTSADYVILVAGVNNLDVRCRDYVLLANKCFQTNLLLCSIP